MDVELIVAILFAFFFIPVHLSFSRKLQKHVKENYPNEWANVSSNRMKMNINSNRMKMNINDIRHVALNDSLKYGFLSQQNDPVIVRFLKFEKLLNSIGLTLIMVCLIFTWFQ